jgi:hypothetical protein
MLFSATMAQNVRDIACVIARRPQYRAQTYLHHRLRRRVSMRQKPVFVSVDSKEKEATGARRTARMRRSRVVSLRRPVQWPEWTRALW